MIDISFGHIKKNITLLNIQKCYDAYLQIRDGKFYPEKGYYDQAHFIREIKKHRYLSIDLL